MALRFGSVCTHDGSMRSLHHHPEREPGYLDPLQFYVASKRNLSTKPLPKRAARWSPGVLYTDVQGASEPSDSTVHVTGLGRGARGKDVQVCPIGILCSENGEF